MAGQAGTDFLVASSGLQMASYFPAQEVKAELWILPYGPVDVAVSFFGAGQGVGGARVSSKHAGFVVNIGGATEKDVLATIEMIRNRVYETSGIVLEPEVKRL